MRIDIHQHLWPASFIDALRARRQPPRLEEWTLVLFGGDRWDIDPAAHEPALRSSDNELICLAPSATLGIDRLPPDEAAELAEAWLVGVLALGGPFRAWAGAGLIEPDPDALAAALDRGAIGLEVAADVLAAPDGIARLAPLLDALGNRPALVHPGPIPGQEAARPRWWTPTVCYVNQLHAAWWAWVDGARKRFPNLPVCFAALAGLGPLHGERHRARGGAAGTVDPLTFVETSSYGTQAVDAVLRVLGVDVICHGSDRPYAAPAPLGLDPAALHAIEFSNPARLLAHPPKEVLV
jgi:6-methylsalicylate decarboxylase